MTASRPLAYLPVMFATCMLFQVIYVACVLLWLVAPELEGHQLLVYLLPQFKFLDVLNFVYGLLLAAVYGWLAAALFVFFHNLWPRIEVAVFRRKNSRPVAMKS
ncbi:MAG: hypothetical protein ACT4OG_08440 [Alphaproteobacteria bacterium]